MNTRQDTFTSLNVRDHNLSEVLRLIHSHGAMSRAALSRETGLSATTISALVTVLLESGFVREVGEAESSGGRPPILMEFEYEHHYAIGIDLGAAHITAIVIDFRGSPIASVTQEFDAMADASGAITAIRALIRQVVKKAGIDLTQVFGIGVGVPAPLEGEQLDRLSPVILPAWKDIDLRAEMRAEFGDLPIYIDNDANSGALAEKWWGRGREHSNLAYIKLGTGVGSGLIINNDIYRGSAGTAGEIGHTTISPNGPLCRCGNHGCMESYVGTPAILANAASKLKGKSSSALQNQNLTVRDVALGAVQGDPVCVQ
ncbi:MAG: ROK family transcriptional regulator, partial [Anaerolineales bacterium]